MYQNNNLNVDQHIFAIVVKPAPSNLYHLIIDLVSTQPPT